MQTKAPAMQDVLLYDSKNIDSIEWPAHEDADYARRFLYPLIKKGTQYYIDNVDVEMMVLKHHELVMPLTVINEKYGLSHVCSPYDHYVSHVLESLHFIKNRLLNALAQAVTRTLGEILRLGRFNQVIIINNWLFATDLYPKDIPEESIELIVSYLKQQFPKHAIVFRSINPCTNQETYRVLKKQRAHLIASRQIYLSDTKNEAIFKTRIFKSDLKLLRESQYEIVEGHQLAPEEIPVIVDLYRKLYIDKYSQVNPHLNTHFIQLLIQQNLLQIKVLKKNNIIDGVVGYFSRHNVLTSPFFGYDQNKSQHSDLYRLLSTILMLEAKEKAMVLHQGAGASFYKKLRRAESYIEYMAVYMDHLPLKRRIPWRLVKGIMNRFAVPFMKKY